jgi:hypothetical protein
MTEFSEMAQKFSKPTTDKTGSYLSQLNTEQQAEINRFGTWLTGKMTDASVASYRSYLAASFCIFLTGGERSDLTSSQRSAVKKYAEYLEWLGTQG